MERNLTEALLRQLTSALVDVAGKKEPYQEQKWILTIIAFAVSGAAVLITILSHIVNNRCWNMLSPTTKVGYLPGSDRANSSHDLSKTGLGLVNHTSIRRCWGQP